uniref:Uncharacterized protein n=1 Tax=Malurus cyaneus samueli TaxID=2593467 RepID=A0A8C5UFY6_9PASS
MGSPRDYLLISLHNLQVVMWYREARIKIPKVTKSQKVWVGRDLKDDPVPTPALSRDTSHCPRLLPAPMSSLALGTARDPGAATASLGTLCQGLQQKSMLTMAKSNSDSEFELKVIKTPVCINHRPLV